MGDEIEARAIRDLLRHRAGGRDAFVSSTKGATGHLLGAAGALEAAFTALAVFHDAIPPTANLRELCPTVAEASENYTIVRESNATELRSRRDPIRAALTNSFGFGGTNASLLFTKA